MIIPIESPDDVEFPVERDKAVISSWRIVRVIREEPPVSSEVVGLHKGSWRAGRPTTDGKEDIMGGTRSSERVREVDIDSRIKRVHLSEED
jgi:hypothetical protein